MWNIRSKSNLSCLFKDSSTLEKCSSRVPAILRIFLPIFAITVILVISNQVTPSHAQGENGSVIVNTSKFDAKSIYTTGTDILGNDVSG